jgi:hypothetical protein
MAKIKKTFLLRLPKGLFIELKAWSKQELRSINRQIEFILLEAVKRKMKDENMTVQQKDVL